MAVNISVRQIDWRWLVASAGALLLGTHVQAADNWEAGKTQYNAICTNCHSSSVGSSITRVAPHPEPGFYPAVKPTGESASYLQGRFNAGVAAGSQMGAPYTNSLRTGNNTSAPIADAVSDIAAYIAKPNFPTLAVSPSSVAFSSTAVGSTATRTIRLTNDGDTDLNVSSVSLTDNTNFSVPPNACSIVAAGNFCEFTLTFQPQSVGTFNGRTLTIAHDALGATATIPVSGSGQGPVTLSAANLNFATVVGTPTTASVVITNRATSNITINTISFSGTAASDYSRDASSTCSAGGTVAANSGTCTLTVRFNPASAVPSGRPATMTLTHSAFGSPQTVSLQGTATAAPQGLLESSASSLTFVDTQISASTAQSITLRNAGSLELQFTSFTIAGANAGDFARSGSCSTASPLAINADCTLTVTFGPGALGSRTATLTIAHNGSNASMPVALSGNGVPVPAPVVAFEPAVGLNFGNQTVGGLFAARTLRLTNSGNATLNVAAVAVEGAAFSNVSAAPCPATLAPSQFCDIDVRFSPPAAAAGYSGAVRVTSNAAGSPHVAALSGNGVANAVPVLVWDGAATPLDFGNVSVGTVSALQSVTLRNSGPGGATLSVINSVGGDAAMFAVVSDPADAATCRAGGVLFEGQTCRIDIRFAPGANGARSATLQAASDGSPPPLRNLLGNGLAGPAPAIEVSPVTATLADTRIGAVSDPIEVVVRSSGAGPLSVTGMTVSGPFTLASKDCPATRPFTLAAGASCAMTVRFVPESEGAANGTLSVSSDAGAAAPSVALSANGQPRADVGGGCSIAEGDSLADPTLWVLLVLSLVALRYRRRQRVSERQPGRR